MIQGLFKNKLFIYLAKFLGAFIILFYGTEAVIGVSAPGGYYIAFVAKYLNYTDWLRSSLMAATSFVVSLFGYSSYLESVTILRLTDGGSIRMVYSCMGYGVMSFWIAFVFANNGSWKRKTAWILGGLVVIWCTNVARLCIVLVATDQQWHSLLGWDHHTWFTICAYLVIFVMIYFYDKSSKRHLITK